MKKEHKNLKLSVFEIVWYSVCGAIALWGLTFIVLGLLAKYLPLRPSDNPLLLASNAYAKVFGLGFFGWGIINLIVAAVLVVIVLLISSKKVDRDVEKAQRRAAIRAQTLAHMNNNANGDEVIDLTTPE